MHFIGTDSQKNTLKNHLSKFNYVSVREKRGVDICREMGINAQWVIDPILLTTKDTFKELLKNAVCELKEDYLFYYFIDPYGGTDGLENLCKTCGVGYHGTLTADSNLLTHMGVTKEKYPYVMEENCKLEDWLKYIINSKYIVTDSFHGVCLAIVFHIPFIYIKGNRDETNGLDRITTILEEFDLSFALVNNTNEAIQDNIMFSNYNWDKVEEKLNRERIRCEDWLKRAIGSELL